MFKYLYVSVHEDHFEEMAELDESYFELIETDDQKEIHSELLVFTSGFEIDLCFPVPEELEEHDLDYENYMEVAEDIFKLTKIKLLEENNDESKVQKWLMSNFEILREYQNISS